MIGVDVHLPVPEHDNLFALLTLLGSRAAVIHVSLHLGDLLVERAEGTDLHPSLTERSLVLLHLAGLHHLAAVWALLAGVELLLVLLQLGARHGLVAHRAQGDVAGAVQRVHHVAGGRDVPPAGEERTSYERAFLSRGENFDVINSTEDTFPWMAEVRPQKHDESQWPLNGGILNE